jgi:hypothetical protein
MLPAGSRPGGSAPGKASRSARPNGPAVGAAVRRSTEAPDLLAPLLDLPGVAAAVAAARESVDELFGHRTLRRHSAAVSAESALRGARASAALEGVEVPLSVLRSGAGGGDPVVHGALRVSAGLGGVVDTWQRAPLQVLARLHLLAAAGTGRPETLGRPSGGPESAARLDALGRIVVGDTAVPAVVLAAVVHGELAALAPFGSADGIVARAAARLTLISRGLDPKAVTVPEVGHLERQAEYATALAGYSSGSPEGLADWLRHCCAAVELGAREALAICEAVRRR